MTDWTDKTLLELIKLAATPIEFDQLIAGWRSCGSTESLIRTPGSGDAFPSTRAKNPHHCDFQQDAESRRLVLQAE